MIRKLVNEDLTIIKNYLNENPYSSLFLSADINKYGFDSDIFMIFADFNNDQSINFIFGKYFDTLLIYSNIKSVNAEIIFNYLMENNMDFNVLIVSNDIFESSIDENDSCEILSLFNSTEEFEGLDMTSEAIKTYIEDNNIYIIKKGNEIASFAMCTATIDILASIGAVCTNKSYRGMGYASALVSSLSSKILDKGLKCFLSYDNPSAGSIYKRLGFKEVGNMIFAIK